MKIPSITRVPKERIDALRELSPNDLGHHYHFGFVSAAISSLGSNKPVNVLGQTVTVRIPPEDSVMVHKATEVAENGDVIAVDMQGHTEHAPWGEMTTRAAIESGVNAAVIDGSITDSREIEELGFDIYARGKSTRTTRLHGRGGEINRPISIGGATVLPGDIAIGNEDGILFIRPDKIDDAVDRCAGTTEEERAQITQLEAGASLAELTGANDLIEEME